MTDYDRVQLAATRLLIHQSISGLPVTPEWMTFDRPIYFDTIQSYCQKTHMAPDFFMDGSHNLVDGYTVKNGITNIVLYNRQVSWGRRKFTLAHELGHIYLGHSSCGPEEEKEANWFASQLLMPECVLMEIFQRDGRLLEQDVQHWFMVSASAARTRINQLKNVKSYRFGREEQKLLKKYLPHIIAAVNHPYLVSV